MQKALLVAALEPIDTLRKYEYNFDFTDRLALLEELKTLPFGAVWEEYCERQGVIASAKWIDEVKKYEKDVLSKR